MSKKTFKFEGKICVKTAWKEQLMKSGKVKRYEYESPHIWVPYSVLRKFGKGEKVRVTIEAVSEGEE